MKSGPNAVLYNHKFIKGFFHQQALTKLTVALYSIQLQHRIVLHLQKSIWSNQFFDL